MYSQPEEDGLINSYSRQKKSKCNFFMAIISAVLITQLVTLTLLVVVSYKMNKLDVDLVNYDSGEIADILSNNGTEKIISVLENINLTDISMSLNKVKHIIDDACYYIFNCDNSGIQGLKNFTRPLGL